jgi:hypothetical protein
MTNENVGILCGIIQIGIGYPFELLKTRSQMHHQYNIFTDMHILYKKKGIRSFYKGCGIPFVISVIINEIQFESYFLMKNKYNDNGVLGGILGGITSGFIMNPFEIMKCHNQNNQKMIYTNKWYMKGLKYTILREIMGCVSYFSIYEIASNNYNIEPFLSGGLAGICSQMINYKIDQKKTQVQLSYKGQTKFVSMTGLYLMIIRTFLVNGCIFKMLSILKSENKK